MAKIFELLITWFEECFSITGIVYLDTIIFLGLEVVAYRIAFSFVGSNANSLGYNSHAMSLVHWIARILFLVFSTVIISFVSSVVIDVIDFVENIVNYIKQLFTV